MDLLTAQQLWNNAVADGRPEVKDWTFEQIVEAGLDVQDDVVIDPANRKEDSSC